MGTLSRRDLMRLSAAALTPVGPAAAEQSRALRSESVPSVASAGVRTGGSRTVRIDGPHDVWVKHVPGKGTTRILTLHGGPGFNHFYLECLEDFLPHAGLGFWYYDQLGCGFSEQPQDKKLWTVDRYCKEVEQVRAALGLDRLILFGHSWGGMLGMEYALRYPQHLSALVVSNMTASVAEYVKYAAELVKRLPADAQAIIARHRARGDFDSPEYQQVLMKEVYARHVCRLDPWPEPIQRAFRFINEAIYNTMQGPDEFNIVGNFKDWDIWDRLHAISVPTLLIAARYDEMAPAQITRMGTLIPNSHVVICERGSHFAMYDDQEAYFKALLPFLHRAQA